MSADVSPHGSVQSDGEFHPVSRLVNAFTGIVAPYESPAASDATASSLAPPPAVGVVQPGRMQSPYNGVQWKVGVGKWEASIYNETIQSMECLGFFSSDHDAATVHDKRARELGLTVPPVPPPPLGCANPISRRSNLP